MLLTKKEHYLESMYKAIDTEIRHGVFISETCIIRKRRGSALLEVMALFQSLLLYPYESPV